MINRDMKIKLFKIYKFFINKKNYILSGVYKEKFEKYRYKKKAILMLTPEHGNLGDHAIAYASNMYIEDNLKEYEIIELNLDEVYKYAKSIKSILGQDDIIFTIGGGNMGNIYYEEKVRRFIIKYFSDNKIISLPQTINFEDKKYKDLEYKKTKKVYNSHKNLTVIAREDISFDIMKSTFNNNNVILNPDMVFYLENYDKYKNNNREKVTICLRQDIESFITPKKRKEIIEFLKYKYKNVNICDTVIQKKVTLENRKYELESIWKKFSESKVVITDRLHGMIFCFITSTPCIVIRNSDHKIIGSYKWIEQLSYIKLIDNYNVEELDKYIQEVCKLKKVEKTDFKNTKFKFLTN